MCVYCCFAFWNITWKDKRGTEGTEPWGRTGGAQWKPRVRYMLMGPYFVIGLIIIVPFPFYFRRSRSMELHGAPLSSIELHGAPWSSMELHGAPWSSMELHRAPQSSIELHGAPWSFMELHGAPWSSVELHGAPRSPVELV